MVRALKWLGKAIGIGMIWVFILSIHMNGEPIFKPISDLVVKNQMISALDEDLGNFVHRLNTAFRLAWSDSPQAAKKHLE